MKPSTSLVFKGDMSSYKFTFKPIHNVCPLEKVEILLQKSALELVTEQDSLDGFYRQFFVVTKDYGSWVRFWSKTTKQVCGFSTFSNTDFLHNFPASGAELLGD